MPAPLMNQGFNPSIPLNMATQQYQRNPDGSFYFPEVDISTPSLIRSNPYSSDLLGLDQQNQYINSAGNYLSSGWATQVIGVG